MPSRHNELTAVSTSAALRAAGIVLVASLLVALAVLSWVSLRHDREAVLSETTMQWSLLAIIASFVLYGALATVLVAGQWPPDREILKALISSVLVAIVWILAAAFDARGVQLETLIGVVAIAYVVIGAIPSSDWKYLTAPVTTVGVAIVTSLWIPLASDTVEYEEVHTVMADIGIMVQALVILTVLPVATLVLTGIGGWLSWLLRGRLT